MKSQSESNSSTPSLSSMGYLTMIVALVPSVAAFSGLEQPFAAAGLSSGTGPRRILRSQGRTGPTAVPGVTTTTPTSSSTRLHYITDRTSELAEPNTKQTQQWWNSIFSSRDQSNAADDYLEFLDKRYNRILHDGEEQKEAKANKGFPVLNWLYQTGGDDAMAQKQKNHQDDALYVLGVANLASKKLLQKHHLLPEEVAAVDAEATTLTDAVAGASAPVAKVSHLFRQVALRREIFLRSQMRYTRLALAFAVRSLVTGPVKATRKLYAMGGGHKSVALTLTTLAALSFLLRPVVQAAASDVTGGAISA